MEKKTITRFLQNSYDLFILVISMAGYVPKNATRARNVVMFLSLFFVLYISSFQPFNSKLAFSYFVISDFFYIGFLFSVPSENGLRHWFMKTRGGEQNGFLAFEATLGFLFFHNAASIGFLASATPGNFFSFLKNDFFIPVLPFFFITGFTVKILAAKAVSIEIYYLKDLFLGRKINEFVITGPYRYFKNPMYGIGQVQAYATAIWYGSEPGFYAAMINQIFIFLFYFLIEKKFVNRVYKNAGSVLV